MKAAIITIGDEILLGQILDTNSQFIARELTKVGGETKKVCSSSPFFCPNFPPDLMINFICLHISPAKSRNPA